MQSGLIRSIGVVFSNGAVLSVSDKSDSVNECTQDISELMKLHIQGVWQNAQKFIKQLPHMFYAVNRNRTTTVYSFSCATYITAVLMSTQPSTRCGMVQ